jgi:hypothetical protein
MSREKYPRPGNQAIFLLTAAEVAGTVLEHDIL